MNTNQSNVLEEVVAVAPEKWKWFGHAGHLCVSQWCRFHLCTQVGGYLISTVGEYWPERSVREIHAEVHDPAWLQDNRHLKGESFDAAYMDRFGFEDIGLHRKYETMVFRAGKPCTRPDCNCGLPAPFDWAELDFLSAHDPGEATRNHYAACKEWGSKRQLLEKQGESE